MMDEYPERYAARGKAFRVEFFTNSLNGQLLAAIREEKPELADG